jgi:hypothetical protein
VSQKDRDFRFNGTWIGAQTGIGLCGPGVVEQEESDMISEIQVHVIARQMFEKHGLEAIAQAAQNAQACENKGDTEEAREWRHIEDAMKMMRGPHQS